MPMTYSMLNQCNTKILIMIEIIWDNTEWPIDVEKRTSILAGYEINVLSQFDLQAAVAHEVLHSNFRDSACSGPWQGFRYNPRITHGESSSRKLQGLAEELE